MVKKIKFDIDFNQDNRLIALSCHKKDYWLAFQINSHLHTVFRRIQDLEFYQPQTDSLLPYPIYYFSDPDSEISWYLISNFHPEGKLFPVMRTIDYFVLLNGQFNEIEIDKVVIGLKKIKGILHAHLQDTKPLKDFENFLSDLELHMIDILKTEKE